MANPLLEVVQDSVLGEVGVIGAGSLDLLDVGLYDGVIVADGLHEEQLVALLHNYPLVKEPPPLPCCIGSVKNCNFTLQSKKSNCFILGWIQI